MDFIEERSNLFHSSPLGVPSSRSHRLMVLEDQLRVLSLIPPGLRYEEHGGGRFSFLGFIAQSLFELFRVSVEES